MPPRGGRGGGGGAGRARPAAGKVRIGGIDIDYDEETQNTFNDRPQPSETFPSYKPTPARPLSTVEKLQIARYCAIRDRIHRGPLYTTFDDERACVDPFNGMETYSQRYVTRKRRIPRLDTRPYVLRFFPEELHGVLEPTAATKRGANGVTAAAPRPPKRLHTELDQEEDLDEAAAALDQDDDEAAAARKAQQDDGELPPDEDVDDDFEEDEEDLAGDYNAEGYFDDGGDDARDDDFGDAGGGGGGGDDYD